MTVYDYNEAKKYLPDFMQDFHDQKDLFKAIHQLYAKHLSENLPACNWVDCHVYTVDFFLWFMSLHGYKLQKIRSNGIEFFDLHETINRERDNRLKSLAAIINPTTPAGTGE